MQLGNNTAPLPRDYGIDVRLRKARVRTAGAQEYLHGEKTVLALIATALVWTLFYGLIVKFTIDSSILFSIKTFVPEVLLCVACSIAIFSDLIINLKKIEILLICNMFLIVTLGFVTDNADNAAVVFRDVVIPVTAFVCITSMKVSPAFANRFISILTGTLFIYVLGSIVLYCIEAHQGYEWTARFYTGYYFWGQDPVSKIQINSNGDAMRLPALTGSSVKSAMGGVAALAVFLSNEKLSRTRRYICCALALICVILFNNRASLVAAIALIALAAINKVSTNLQMRTVSYICLAFAAMAVFTILLENDGSLSVDSLFLRFSYWKEILSSDGIENTLLPTHVYSLSSGGAGIEGVGLTTSWDNGFLYLLFSFGAPFLLLFIADIIGYWKTMVRKEAESQFAKISSQIIYNIIISTLLLSITTNIFQGRSWYFLFVIICGVSIAVRSSFEK